MLGNILLVIIVLCLFGLLSLTASPIPSGDRGMGASILLLLCGVSFLVFTGLLTWNLGHTNRFDWVSSPGIQRNGILLIGWLAFGAATVASALFKIEWHQGEFPQFLRWLSQAHAALWLPFLMLVPAFILLNFERQAGYAPGYIKTPMMTGFMLSILMGLGLLFGYIRAKKQQQAANIEYEKSRDDQQHENHMTWIAEQKPTDPIVNILSLTGRYHDSDVRDSAVAKVLSHPDWEAQLIYLLSETEFDTEAYQFIDGNQVEHPELFVEPINVSIRRIAGEIKNRIKDANDLQDRHFDHFGLDRLFRAIDEQFTLPGANFAPAVKELQKALNTPRPEQFKDVEFNVTPIVDDWLEKHK